MKISVAISSVGAASLLSSCFVPCPHKSVYREKVKVSVIDAENLTPIRGVHVEAQFGKGKIVSETTSKGLDIPEDSQWHIGKLYSPITHSVPFARDNEIGKELFSLRLIKDGYKPYSWNRMTSKSSTPALIKMEPKN